MCCMKGIKQKYVWRLGTDCIQTFLIRFTVVEVFFLADDEKYLEVEVCPWVTKKLL